MEISEECSVNPSICHGFHDLFTFSLWASGVLENKSSLWMENKPKILEESCFQNNKEANHVVPVVHFFLIPQPQTLNGENKTMKNPNIIMSYVLVSFPLKQTSCHHHHSSHWWLCQTQQQRVIGSQKPKLLNSSFTLFSIPLCAIFLTNNIISITFSFFFFFF